MSRDIDYFLAVQKAGSVSKAAELLYISQPSLSQFLVRLESRLGAQLFDRTKTPWGLTDIGRCYAEYVAEYKQLEARLEDDIVSIKNGNVTKQSLSIGIPPWKGTLILPKILLRYSERFPNVSITVHEEIASRLRILLQKGVVDIAIMNTPFYDKHVVHEKLVDERILLAVAKDHPMVRNLTTSLESPAYFDIASIYDQRLIIPGPDLILTSEVTTLLAKNSLKPMRVLYLNNILSCLNLAALGYGFTFTPEFGLDQCPGTDRLAFFTLDRPSLSWSISIVYRDHKSLNVASKAFLEISKKQFAGIF